MNGTESMSEVVRVVNFNQIGKERDMIRILSGLVLVVLSMQASASGNFTTSITEVGVTISGDYAYINISPAEDKSTCTNHSQVRFELDTDIKKSALSIALAAKMAEKKIRIWFSDGGCLGDSPRPSSITVVE